MNKLWTPSKRPKPPKEDTLESILWEEFKALAIQKGFTDKVPQAMTYINKKGQAFKLMSTVGGYLTVQDTSINKTYEVLRKVI